MEVFRSVRFFLSETSALFLCRTKRRTLVFPCAKEKWFQTADPKDLTVMDFSKNCNNIIRFPHSHQTEKLAKSELALARGWLVWV